MKLPRKWCMILTLTLVFLFFFGPRYFQRMFFYSQRNSEKEECSSPLIPPEMYKEADDFNVNINGYNGNDLESHDFLLFSGSGYIGVSMSDRMGIYVKRGRTLSLRLPYYPFLKVDFSEKVESTVLNYRDGMIHMYDCYHDLAYVSYKYYVHRTMPHIFVQEVSLKSTHHSELTFDVTLRKSHDAWDDITLRNLKLKDADLAQRDYVVASGRVPVSVTGDSIMVVVVTRALPITVVVLPYETITETYLTAVRYIPLNKREDEASVRQSLERKAIADLTEPLLWTAHQLQQDHIFAWNHLWDTGFSISNSKASGVLNGDTINATIYYVLSSVIYSNVAASNWKHTVYDSSVLEGCYASNHHTLEAENLWSKLTTLEDMNTVVDLWLLTLDKQGCHKLMNDGATGVVQAMVLSFGSFRFTKNHLEFNMHPEHLHRNYYFRRISYGSPNRINVTTQVETDNKAMIYVAMDKSDEIFYACEAGCLDGPVQLRPVPIQFPVKITRPFTSILYISPNRQHLDDMRQTLHVKEVAEAPAQEHNTMILHQHGHHLRGLPTFFWITVCILIVIFHLFLIKLIYSEYKDHHSPKPRSYENARTGIRYKVLFH